MKLSTKISASMGSLTVLIAILAVYLLMQMQSINETATVMGERNIPVIDLAGKLNNDVSEYRIAEVLHIYATDPAVMKNDEKELAKGKKRTSGYLADLNGLVKEGEVKAVLELVNTGLNAYYALSDKMLDISRQNHTEEAVQLLLGDSHTSYRKLSDALNALVAAAKKNADGMNAEADAMFARSNMIGIGLTMLSILIAVGLTILIVRNAVRQLGKDPGELNAIAHRVVDGDYNIDDGSKKMGVYGAIVEMVNALETNIENARRESENAREQSRKAQEAMQRAEAASQEAQSKTEAMLVAADKLEQVGSVVSSASTELSAQIEQSDRGAAESAQRLSEAATAMNEMNATVQEVARNAGSASNASAETKQKAEAGAEVVAKAVRSIDQVHQMSLELKDDMTQLNGHAQDITRIMGVISDIADQTNLLALNAAIEAARAGDAGRGFAVVADEVRKLAEKTMASTQDVGNAIKAIQESTSKSMTGVDQAVERIGEATELAGQSGAALEEIVTTVEATADQVNAIATASEEQSAASEEINQSIVQVNDMARQTAEAMAEAAKAVSDLAAQAQGLTNLIQELKEA
ncbi:methyl-accepting chemotaxis protein [Desulfovibrio fairfieldensis]|uniref:Chemotaxis protein n=1 Tax=Desulfovibrio fairfieldensis TaxID=44742 RepID=A0A109W4I5_9BACT|nr:methyl-accepting chemotaxis protein [Desulfovibrio fairfieldensis]AMD90468.1 chemotaxis protein [Desulfovibrio fairfieldensis]